jgi:hypothetical protein
MRVTSPLISVVIDTIRTHGLPETEKTLVLATPDRDRPVDDLEGADELALEELLAEDGDRPVAFGEDFDYEWS